MRIRLISYIISLNAINSMSDPIFSDSFALFLAKGGCSATEFDGFGNWMISRETFPLLLSKCKTLGFALFNLFFYGAVSFVFFLLI